MFAHTPLFKRKGPVVVSTLLFGWMVFNSSTAALADKRRDDWNRRSRFSAGSNCRNEDRRDHRNYQRNNYYQRGNYYQYQRARDYRQDRSYQPYRYNQSRGYYNQYRPYDRNWNDRRYRGYDERSTAESALIIAGSSGAGAAIGGLLGGTKGAAVGAIAGGVAGVVYDQHTDNRR
jgi:hypothetical protein